MILKNLGDWKGMSSQERLEPIEDTGLAAIKLRFGRKRAIFHQARFLAR
jgi:hypothetical protein